MGIPALDILSPVAPEERGRQPGRGALTVISRYGCIHRNRTLLEESITGVNDLFCAFSIELTLV